MAWINYINLVTAQALKRAKEIGIRKVNGARISEVLAMLNRDFVRWVAVAFVIATPVAWYVRNKWLENFAYKTELSWWILHFQECWHWGLRCLRFHFNHGKQQREIRWRR